MSNYKKSELSLILTSYGLDNTFLSLLRTSAVFTGVAALLLKHKDRNIARILLIATAILTLAATFSFYYESKTFKSQHHTMLSFDKILPIIFSVTLVIMLLILFFGTFMG